MDVIVDTCILFSDPFMRSNNFKDLFQHLRRTDSRLVILPIVLDEVVQDMRKSFLIGSNKTHSALVRPLEAKPGKIIVGVHAAIPNS
jgi:hypothetical protein